MQTCFFAPCSHRRRATMHWNDCDFYSQNSLMLELTLVTFALCVGPTTCSFAGT
jgi:hypothetical protein